MTRRFPITLALLLLAASTARPQAVEQVVWTTLSTGDASTPAPTPPQVITPTPMATPAAVEMIDAPAMVGNRFWASGEYLHWWIKDGPLQTPILTVGSQADPSPGGLGQPGTLILMGGSDTEYGVRSGGRFTIGSWIDNDRTVGIEANYLFLADRSVDQIVSSTGLSGSATLAVPFIDATTGAESVTFVALPPTFAGTALLSQTSQLKGTEINALYNVASGPWGRVDLLGGFRYLYIREKLAFSTSSPFVPPGPQDVFATLDEFVTRNNFYGGQFGGRVEHVFFERIFLNVGGKVAFGSMEQATNITGFLLTNDFNGLGIPQPFTGGYFALPSNIGVYRRSRFAVVPEVTCNLGYQFTQGSRVFFGYTFLYANSVTRPGDHIDRVINSNTGTAFFSNPNAGPGLPARPAFNFNDSSFWAQGISLGLELRF